ncbi:unnamed protein product [Auanema sp. JU1783]|nr:unnamed protein product [Auanema sp. JU1783]
MISFLVISLSVVLIGEAAPSTSFPPQANLTCLVKPRSNCFAGKCPSEFTCIDNLCCKDTDILTQTPDCTDFLENCESINCRHRDFYDFARANCALTCGFCDDKPLAPQYNCNDILDDCKSRVQLCQDREYKSIMNLYCPRTCATCNYSEFDASQCEDTFTDCAERGQNFCDDAKTSLYQLTVGCGKYCNAC